MRLFSPKKSSDEFSGVPVGEDEGTGLLLEVWDWMKSIVIALIAVVVIHQFGFHLSTVRGASMQPTLEEGEWLFINKTVRFTGFLKRGDVVVIKEADGIASTHPYLVKRVIAVAGDEVSIRSGKLYVNDQEVQEAYTDSAIEDGRFEPYTVADNHLFVMGDNRHRYASYDSRSFGAVSIGQVEGKAEWIVWPLQKWRSL
ncbi:signal peptidase I [Paenibacillus allorhizosphaerae]|uniref:Signal peptidase I n=1 Tax=Paenibacillus allorhizosphaerae TaxID=2849866 RepID=A0ABN7TPB2_9BACL|nr:signal peptidase I [Paenibacillus allorhizosphaerae]CAG7649774.1 Signal peptidase I P [Paenibacillus allorhizosphaerae]